MARLPNGKHRISQFGKTADSTDATAIVIAASGRRTASRALAIRAQARGMVMASQGRDSATGTARAAHRAASEAEAARPVRVAARAAGRNEAARFTPLL